jgi:hypothetical protein
MSDQPILFCPQCNHVCKSLRGLAQHITHRPACRHKSLPILDGISIQKPTVHQSFVQLDAPYAHEAMEPMWHQNDDHDTFPALQPFPVAADLNVESETLQFVSNQQNQLDNHISRQLTDNDLVGSYCNGLFAWTTGSGAFCDESSRTTHVTGRKVAVAN